MFSDREAGAEQESDTLGSALTMDFGKADFAGPGVQTAPVCHLPRVETVPCAVDGLQ